MILQSIITSELLMIGNIVYHKETFTFHLYYLTLWVCKFRVSCSHLAFSMEIGGLFSFSAFTHRIDTQTWSSAKSPM